jgi:hypothetical protein
LRSSEKCLMEQVLQEQESLSQLKATNQALERQVATLLLLPVCDDRRHDLPGLAALSYHNDQQHSQ